MVNYTPFKQTIKRALDLDSQKWVINYSDFPHMADFACEKQKIVVFLDEYPRLVKGHQKMRNISTVESEKHFRERGFEVYYLDYSKYHPNPAEMLSILK